MQTRVAILLGEGFADSGLAVALDVFRAANALASQSSKAPHFAVDVVTARGGRVRAASGLTIGETVTPRAAARADVVLVPGVWMESPAVLDSMLARDDVEVLARTARRAHERGAIVASSCSGAFVLGKAGLLDGRSATTTWWLADEFARRFPAARLDVSRALIVDGRVVTAGAVFAQADVALHVVTRLAGPSLARRCSKVLLLDGHAAQAPYMAVAHLRSDDPLIRRAEAWIRAHLAEDFDMATVARRAGTSTRTLSRRLRETLDLSPIGFVQRLRVEAAVHLLETTRLTVEEIGPRVGYADPSSLRRLVRREIRATPSMLRAPP